MNFNTPSQQERDYLLPRSCLCGIQIFSSQAHSSRYLLILCGNVLQQHNAPLNTISEMVVPDINILGPVMEYQINREFYETVVITMYHYLIHLMTKKTNKYLPHLDGLTCRLTGYNYSASAELSATDLCFLLYQEIDVEPILKIPPDVLFLSVGLPALSASVKPHSFTSSNCLYHNPYPDVPLR